MAKALLLAGILCAAAPGSAGAAAPASPPEDVSVSFHDTGDGSYRVEGRFTVEAPPALVWEVLTDYEGIEAFVSSMRRSRVRERKDGRVLLEQEAAAQVLFFSRTMRVLLDVVERPEEEILFKDLSGEDFEFYRGAWRIEPAEGGTEVRYELRAKRRFRAPEFLAKGVARKTSGTLLEEVLLEIHRRLQSRNAPDVD